MASGTTIESPHGETYSVWLGNYLNGQMRVQLWDDEGPAATLSVAYDGSVDLFPGEFLAKVWSENEEIVSYALESRVFIDTGRRIPMGFVEAHVWKVTEPAFSGRGCP